MADETPRFWTDEFDGPVAPSAPDPPMAAGWYGVMIAVDHHDGFRSDCLYPEALYWDGGWRAASYVTVVMRSPQPFEDEDDACEWALQHDSGRNA